MSPQRLVDQLESLGVIEDRVVKKIRRQFDKEKKPSVNSILRYLVKREHITEKQARKLKEQIEKADKAKKDVYHTDDLTAGVRQTAEPDPIDEVADAATRIQEVDEQVFDDLEEVAAVPTNSPADGNYADPLADPLADPMGDPMMDSGAYASGEQKQLAGFTGKRDQSNQWQTKWLFVGFGILGALLILGAVLILAVGLTSAEDRFKVANASFEQGAYQDAISKFDEFLEKHPSHEKAPLAKVKRVQALLASTFEAKNWDETITRAENKLPELVDDETVNLEAIRDDLAVMLPQSTLAIARRAVKQNTIAEMKVQLDKANHANSLVNNPAYIPNSKRKNATVAKILEQIEDEIARGELLIKKQQDYETALDEIKRERNGGNTEAAFKVYNRLIRQYGDLSVQQELQDEMRAVSQQESELVVPSDIQLVSTNTDRESAVESSVVLVSKNGTPISSLTGEVVPVLADGSVYGLDVGDGSVKWRRFVGYETSIQPVKFEDSILVSDQNQKDLLMVSGADGSLVWRTEIGRDFLAPTVTEEFIALTTVDGSILKIDPATGKSIASSKLPQSRASVNCGVSTRTPYLYQPGHYSNLYVISQEDFTCKEVYYSGHYKGSIAVPPVNWSKYILLAINESDSCSLQVLTPTEDGLNLQPVQRLNHVTKGTVTRPLIRFGRWLLIASEIGDMKILEMDNSDENNPIRIFAQDKFENADGNAAYLLTEGSQLWIASKGIMRYRVQRSLGQFNREVITNHSDFFLGPLQKYGDSLIHTRRRSGSAHVSASAVDAKTLKQIWRTDLSGPLAGQPQVVGDKIVAVSSQGDLFSIDSSDMEKSSSDKAIKSSTIAENLLFDQMLKISDTTSVCVGPPGRADILFVDSSSNTSKLLKMQQPANKPVVRPVLLGDKLLVPSQQGQIVRVDPKTGRTSGTSFLPPVSPDQKIQWRHPAILSDTSFVIGGDQSFYLIDASSPRSLKEVASLDVESPIRSQAVKLNNSVYSIVGAKLVKIDVGSNLELANSVTLATEYNAGPWVCDSHVCVKTNDNQLVSFDAELNEKWSVDVGAAKLAGVPESTSKGIVLTFANGTVMTLNRDSGEKVSEFELGQPIVHHPVIVGNKLYFAGLDGTVHITAVQ